MPQKTKRLTVTIPGEFLELIEQRKQEEHLSTDSKYLLSLVLFDLMTRSSHKITRRVVNEPERTFYRVVAEVVQDFPAANAKMPGKWLKHRLEELREERAAESK